MLTKNDNSKFLAVVNFVDKRKIELTNSINSLKTKHE